MGNKVLPEKFKERMKLFLGEEYDSFLAEFEKERCYGLRRNPLKSSAEEFLRRMPFSLEQVSWAEEGYYYRAEEQPGRHVFHEAGVYYIQEPSAMAVVEALAPAPGERVLDLCAAPGGKSTQIAGKMAGRGLLISNEYVSDRSRILSQNIERMGARNCVVCNETPERLAAYFPAFFDKILVDAPCSGEGMFRKDDVAIAEWSEERVQQCADRQLMILEAAAKLLKAGGALVYSTCTFEQAENEDVISRFVQMHTEFAVQETMRLMPHKVRGEGHFIARLYKRIADEKEETGVRTANHEEPEKNGEGAEGQIGVVVAQAREEVRKNQKKEAKRKYANSTIQSRALESQVQEFLTEETGLAEDWLALQGGALCAFGEQIYLVPGEMPDLRGLKVIRPGLHLGAQKKNRMEPSHALALALLPEETKKAHAVTLEEAKRYQKGEGLVCGTDERGWRLLVCEGYPIGFGKAVNGQMKNHYPKGLRRY